MSHKLVVITVLLILISACGSNSQKNKKWSSEDLAKRQTEIMIKELSLTEEQEAVVTKINIDFASELNRIREDAAGDREKMRTLRSETIRKKKNKLKEILNEEQFAKYNMLEQERAKEMRNGQGRGF